MANTFNYKYTNGKLPTVANAIEPVAMCDFLDQFKSKNNWAVFGRDIVNKDIMNAAKESGFIKSWKPPKGSSYHETLVCTLKGRLYMRKHM